MNAQAFPVVSRPCRCKCGRSFTPHWRRPGQEYIYGHKPKAAGIKPKAGTPKPPTPDPAKEQERRLLDYRLALASMRREEAALTQTIDGIDNVIEGLRQAIAAAQAQKDKAADRHLDVSTSITCIEALIDGRSLKDEIGADDGQGTDGTQGHAGN